MSCSLFWKLCLQAMICFLDLMEWIVGILWKLEEFLIVDPGDFYIHNTLTTNSCYFWQIMKCKICLFVNCSEKSALWVLEWMQMEESFVSLLYGVVTMLQMWLKFLNFYFISYERSPYWFHVVHNVHNKLNILIYDIKLQLDAKAVRMKVTMILLLGTHK